MTVNKLLTEIKSTLKHKKELEYFFIHQNRYRYILNKILKLNSADSSRILDIGCYPLHLFSALRKLGFEVYGISSKQEPVKIKSTTVLNLEIDNFPFPPRFFDLALFFETIEHLTINPTVYLKKIWKVLKPGGILLLTTPNVANLKNRAKLILGKNIYFSLDQLYDTHLGDDSIYFRHNREFTGKELKMILNKEGFSIRALEYFNSYSPFRRKLKTDPLFVRIVKIIGFILTYLHPTLKDSIYIEAYKLPRAKSPRYSFL